MAKNHKRDKGARGEVIKAICPRCGKVHSTKEFYTGRGTLRKYCESCNFYKADFTGPESYPFHIPHRSNGSS